jgi:hypothetical protein
MSSGPTAKRSKLLTNAAAATGNGGRTAPGLSFVGLMAPL